MGASGVAGYAAVNAQVRSLYSTMIPFEMWRALCDAADFNSLVLQLKNTVYAPYLSGLNEQELTSRRIVYEIKKHLVSVYTTVLHLVPEQARPLIQQMYRLYEVDNLKAVLRGVMIGETWQKVRFMLFPLGEDASFPFQAMMESTSIESAIEYLRATPYYFPVSHAMERFHAEQSLFPLEVSLDLDYWRELWKNVKRLELRDRNRVMRLIGSVLDENNLTWALRYRHYHHLSEEEIINYTLPFGFHVKDEDIRAIAAGGDAARIIDRAYPVIASDNLLMGKLEKSLPELELQLQRHTQRECREAFSGYPFHAGIPVAYLLLTEMEIQDLTVLLEAKSMNIPVDRFRRYLLISCDLADAKATI